jgi:multiple sugar transport system permease protein
MRPHTSKRLTNYILNSVTWIIVALTVFPIFWMVFASLHTNDEILRGITSLALPEPQWGNYRDMWINISFITFFKNSLIICSITMVLSCSFAVMAGYALAKYRFFGSKTLGISIISTQMIPGIMFLLPIYLLFLGIKETLGIPMINTYWGMILVYTAFYTPMSIWIMRSFFVSIPKDLEESAIIDGCTRFQAFRKVILPLAVPGMIATCVYIFLTAWDELLFAWVLTTGPEVQTIPVGIRFFVGQYQNRYDLLMSAATVVTIPVIVTFFLTQKYFIRGMTAGAVKG